MAQPQTDTAAAAPPDTPRRGLLQRSRQALQESYASHALAEQSFESALGTLVSRAPVACGPQTPLRDALAQMQERGVGSMLVTDPAGRPVGILTRYDILGRIT